ncbi:MAG: hypothetical protein HC831_20220 [Chloroflexia bacterium]|nr:hypothetical protein [Chloroflexia bacterium]
MIRKLHLIIIAVLFWVPVKAQSSDDLLNNAIACADKGDYICAEKFMDKLIKKEKEPKRLALFYSNIGTFQRRQGKTKDAFKSYSKAIEKNPFLVVAYTNRASLYVFNPPKPYL